MKTLALVFLISFYSGMQGVAQNRIQSWDIEKITSVQIELTSPNDETYLHIFNRQQDIDTIMTFLKDTDFKELEDNSIDTDEQMNNWKCKIIFQGQRDQVYLYKNSACIGKTSFIINNTVIEDFRCMVKKLLNTEPES